MPISISYPPPFVREPRKNLQPIQPPDPEDEIIEFGDPDELQSVRSDEDSTNSSSGSSSSDDSSTSGSTGSADTSGQTGKESFLSTDTPPSDSTSRNAKEDSDLSDQDADDSPRNFDDAANPQKIRHRQDAVANFGAIEQEEDEPPVEEVARRTVSLKDKYEATLWDVIMKKRQELARARRHKSLRFHERRYKEEREEEARNKRLEKLQIKWKLSFMSMHQTRHVIRKTMLERIQQTARDKHERDIEDRNRQLNGIKHMLGRWLEWDREVLVKKEKEKAVVKEALEKQAKVQQKAAREAEEEAKLASRVQELGESQEALQLLRRHGTYPAVNPQVREEEEEPMETDKVVVVRPRGGAVLVITKPSTHRGSSEPPPHVSYFNVDLTRYRMMEELRGQRLGITGGVALAEDLKRDDCCLKLQVLDLRDCKIGRAGLDALGEALVVAGGRCLVHTLILRGNELTGQSMKHFGDSLAKGALQYMTSLDLKNNLLGNHGAGHVASFLFHQSAPRLEYLYLQRNDIGDQGAVAMYKVLVAAQRWCPKLKEVHVRQNKVTRKAFQQMPHCPRIFDI